MIQGQVYSTNILPFGTQRHWYILHFIYKLSDNNRKMKTVKYRNENLGKREYLLHMHVLRYNFLSVFKLVEGIL